MQLIDIVSHHICFSRCGTRLMKPASPDQFSSACIYQHLPTNTQTFCIFFQSRRYNGIIIKCILPLLYHMPHIPHAGQLLWFGHGKGHWKWTHPSIENKQQNDWNIILSISEKNTEEVTSVSLWMKLLMCPSWNSSVSVTIISTVKEQSRRDFQSSHKERRQMTDGAFLNEKLKSA